MVSYLPETLGLDINVFENDPLSQQFYIDTSYSVTKRKTFNVKCLYDTFAELCELDADGVKDLLIKEIQKNKPWFIITVCSNLGHEDDYIWSVVQKTPETKNMAQWFCIIHLVYSI